MQEALANCGIYMIDNRDINTYISNVLQEATSKYRTLPYHIIPQLYPLNLVDSHLLRFQNISPIFQHCPHDPLTPLPLNAVTNKLDGYIATELRPAIRTWISIRHIDCYDTLPFSNIHSYAHTSIQSPPFPPSTTISTTYQLPSLKAAYTPYSTA